MKLYVSLPQGDTWGWGICGKNLIKEFKRLEFQSAKPLTLVDDIKEADAAFVCINDVSLCPYPEVNALLWEGNRQTIPVIGYCFFEEDLPDVAVHNATLYSLILAGSAWCSHELREKGITNVHTLIQGIDSELFFKLPPKEEDGRFTLFSGGKFEYRKGQDIVLASFKLLQDKYTNLHLLTNWHNHWAFSADTMSKSNFIKYERVFADKSLNLRHICNINGIDPDRVEDIGLVPNDQMRNVFARTDLGVFPNRCEGGTNLVLMEYMACGRPVLANQTTGQADLFEFDKPIVFETPEDLALMIESAIALNGKGWDLLGDLNSAKMEDFTWENTAKRLIQYIELEIKAQKE